MIKLVVLSNSFVNKVSGIGFLLRFQEISNVRLNSGIWDILPISGEKNNNEF